MTGTQLAFDDAGSASDTIVLLHGAMFDRRIFLELSARLAYRHRVLAVDLPGFGASPPVDVPSSASFGDAVAEFIEEETTGDVTLLGWSMGATVALQVASDYPDRVQRLILAGATPCLTQRLDWPIGLRRTAVRDIAVLLRRDWEAGVIAFVDLVVSGGDRIVRQQLLDMALGADQATTHAIFAEAQTLDLRPALSHITAFGHILTGTADVVTSPLASQYIASQIDALWYQLPDADHAAFLTDPDTFAATLELALTSEVPGLGLSL